MATTASTNALNQYYATALGTDTTKQQKMLADLQKTLALQTNAKSIQNYSDRVDTLNQYINKQNPPAPSQNLGYSQYDLLSNDASYQTPTQSTNIAQDEGTRSPINDASTNEDVTQTDNPSWLRTSADVSGEIAQGFANMGSSTGGGTMQRDYGQGLSVDLTGFLTKDVNAANAKRLADAQMANKLRANTALDIGISPVFKTIKSARGGYRGTKSAGGSDNPLTSAPTLLGA